MSHSHACPMPSQHACFEIRRHVVVLLDSGGETVSGYHGVAVTGLDGFVKQMRTQLQQHKS
eukprot:m.297098 g.297098  ORF g.297098 m.297098 type:complete len:61 (-) comp19525_c0_seq3:67-249(-)